MVQYAAMTLRLLAGAIALLLVSTSATLAQTPPPAKAPGRQVLAPPAAVKVTLPPAIDKAFKAAYPNAAIKHVSKETEAGKQVYEVESVDGGRRRDLIYRPDGTVVSFEEELAEADVPAAVSQAIKARYPKATITFRERSVTGATVEYEIQLKGAGPGSVTLTPDGKWVSPKAAK